ncbi:hypothetical protein [Massilia sp. TWP1-3-3]|uniref:hypothetical protein n=1 Tax=Massilia sp. TWP1-3-3 TaxID=2804573 RepID=UPI003CF9A3F7
MTRQAFVRVLLSLLLLVSQQLASTHVLSHLTGQRNNAGTAQAQARTQVDADGALKAALAQDQSCNQCLAFAQLAGPLVSSPAQLDVPQQASFAIAGIPARAAGARIILAFQSRAPPVLS